MSNLFLGFKTQKSNIIFFMLILITNSFTLITPNHWNFIKGGDDWPHSCKKGKQAPIDIKGPFTYKSNQKNSKD